jgi:hypothetical protein
MQVQSDHTPAQAREAAAILAESVAAARESLAKMTSEAKSPLRQFAA